MQPKSSPEFADVVADVDVCFLHLPVCPRIRLMLHDCHRLGCTDAKTRPVELSRGLKHKHREFDARKGKLWFRVSESNTSGFIRLESEPSTIHSKNRLSFSLVYLVVYFSG